MIITEITQARNMVSFAKKNISAFKRKQFIYPMLFGFFKLISGFIAAGTNTIVLMQQSDVVDAIKDFISIAIIFEIDNIMATTVQKSTCAAMAFLDDEEVQFKITRRNDSLTDFAVLRYNNPCV
jgi:hypothetical protein